MKSPKVSIIIPIYNSKDYLGECLESVFAQTIQDFELIVVDDGSTDGSREVAEQYQKQHKNLHIITQSNHGQGYARNRAIEKASGKYLLFIDSDDFIEPNLLEETVRLADENRADLVNFNWRRLLVSASNPDKILDNNVEPFAGQSILQNTDCDQLLLKRNYYAWDSLYRRSFIVDNSIKFGEGYIYEDFEFVVGCASYANCICLVDEALYIVRESLGSSSRSKYDTDRHYRDFLQAVSKSFTILKPRTDHSSFYLAADFLEKFIIYYQQRVPRKYLAQYLRDFVDILHGQYLVAPSGHDYKFLRSCIARHVFSGRKYRLFKIGVIYKTRIMPVRAKLRGVNT